jgi:SHS2 domain-containing protein
VVYGVVEIFADTSRVGATREMPLEVNAALDEDLVVALLDDVIYLVDADGLVVTGVTLDEDETGGFEGCFLVAPVSEVEAVGPPPKGVSRSDLTFERADSGWRCHVVVDV